MMVILKMMMMMMMMMTMAVMIQFLTLAIFGGRTALQTEFPLE